MLLGPIHIGFRSYKMLKLIKIDMDMNVINTTKKDPSKILILPFDVMIKFICCVGKVDKPLF
jgi:hypothetical protein